MQALINERVRSHPSVPVVQGVTGRGNAIAECGMDTATNTDRDNDHPNNGMTNTDRNDTAGDGERGERPD